MKLVFVNTKDNDYQDQINDLGATHFLSRAIGYVYDNDNKRVGEFTGYKLNANEILEDKEGSFFVMDGISQLLNYAYVLLVEKEAEFLFSTNVFFLNRLSLYEENHLLELEVLKYLIDLHESVIYSLGATELLDHDFLEYQASEKYSDYWYHQLISCGWEYYDQCNLFYDININKLI